jgi:glucokinase
LARERYPVQAPRSPGEVVGELTSRLRALAERTGIAWERVSALGYSMPGPLDRARQVVISCLNLGPSWENVPLRAILQDSLQIPVWLEMDALAATLGEAWLGAGRDVADFIYLVVGTGVGCGVLVDGRPVRGWAGSAGEIGHLTIVPGGPACNCGNYGCLEALTAGPAIARRAQAAILQGRETILAEEVPAGEITAKTVFAAARSGDAVALSIVHETAEYLGLALAGLANLLNPQVIALGGGVGQGAGDVLLAAVRRAALRHSPSWITGQGLDVRLAQLGEDAGLLGAARVGWLGLSGEA